MLSSLHIENVAVIKNADIDFGAGFNVLTGETGAGKSILIDSINLILGAKPSRDLIRSGENEASVSALFSDIAVPLSKAGDSEISPDEDGCLYITRSIDARGKSKNAYRRQDGPGIDAEGHRVMSHQHSRAERQQNTHVPCGSSRVS